MLLWYTYINNRGGNVEMIIQIEDSYRSWYLRDIDNYAYVWEILYTKKPNTIWWKVHKRSDHRAQPDYSYVKEVKTKCTKIYFKGGEGM